MVFQLIYVFSLMKFKVFTQSNPLVNVFLYGYGFCILFKTRSIPDGETFSFVFFADETIQRCCHQRGCKSHRSPLSFLPVQWSHHYAMLQNAWTNFIKNNHHDFQKSSIASIRIDPDCIQFGIEQKWFCLGGNLRGTFYLDLHRK